MYSGLPDIPCQNPDTAILGSSDLTRMMSCLGRKFFTTETTSKVKRSGLVPAKVVKPYPVCPRCTLDTGKISVGCACATAAHAITPIAAQCRTNPRMCSEHSGPVQVPPQPSPGRTRAGPGPERGRRDRNTARVAVRSPRCGCPEPPDIPEICQEWLRT